MATSILQQTQDSLCSLDKDELLSERKEMIGYNVALNYSKTPLVLLRGKGQYLYDEVSEYD